MKSRQKCRDPSGSALLTVSCEHDLPANSLLTHFRPMDFSIKIQTFKSGWSIINIEGSQVMKQYCIFSLKIGFVLTNSAYPEEMPLYVVLHLGLHCLQKNTIRGFWSPNG